MNNQLLNDFIQKIRQNIDSLYLEINKTPIDTKETTQKLRQTKNDLTHMFSINVPKIFISSLKIVAFLSC